MRFPDFKDFCSVYYSGLKLERYSINPKIFLEIIFSFPNRFVHVLFQSTLQTKYTINK